MSENVSASKWPVPTRREFLGALGAAAVVLGSGRWLDALERKTSSASEFGREWWIQSSEVSKGDGESLSRGGAETTGWYKVDVPCTVLGGLVANGEYPQMFYADNLKKVP